MAEEQIVTVAGVPVTIEVTDGHLAVTVGRFEPSAAVGLRIHPRYGNIQRRPVRRRRGRRHGPQA